MAPALTAALAWWWQVRGRLAAQAPLLREAVGRAEAGSEPWCVAHAWLGQVSLDATDPAAALRHFTAVRDAIGDGGPFPLQARCLSGRSVTLLTTGRLGEAAQEARRFLALAREGDHPMSEALALAVLGLIACVADDRVGAVQLAGQAEQILADRHGAMPRVCGHALTTVLIEADEPAAAERVCTAALAGARDAGDLWSLGNLLEKMVVLDLNAGRFEVAAAHLREALQTALQTGVRARLIDDLDCCGYLCFMTGRMTEAVTIWAAVVALQGSNGFTVPAHPDKPEGWFQRQEPLAEARRALGPDQARAAQERGQVMSQATAAEYALMLTAPGPPARGRGGGPGRAQPAGTRAGHPGRPGAHRRADRGSALHQRAHGQLAPGPHPRQDRLPAPRRPHPPGPQHRPGLTAVGDSTHRLTTGQEGPADPCRRPVLAGESRAAGPGKRPVPSR